MEGGAGGILRNMYGEIGRSGVAYEKRTKDIYIWFPTPPLYPIPHPTHTPGYAGGWGNSPYPGYGGDGVLGYRGGWGASPYLLTDKTSQDPHHYQGVSAGG